MVLVLLQTADNHDSHDTFYTPHLDRDPSTMYRIFARTIAKPILLSKGNFVASKLAMHVPGTAAPSQNRLPLPRDPYVVIRHNTRMRAGVEENLVLVGERNIDYNRCRKGQKTTSQRGTQFPCIIGGEVVESQRFVYAGY